MFTFFGGVVSIGAVVLFATALTARYRVQSPSVGWFAAVASTAGLGAVAIGIGLLLSRALSTVFSAIILALLLPLPWIMFSFDYVGKDEFVAPRAALLISAPTSVGLFATVVIFGGQVFPWFRLPPETAASGLTAVFLSVLSMSQFFALLYAGGVMMVGSGLILWTFERYPHLDSATGIALITFGTVPWLSLLFALQLETTSFFAFSALATFGLAAGAASGVALVGPSQLFGRVPAAGNIGPQTIIEELQHVVLVTDGNGTIVEVNARAHQTFDDDNIGRAVDDLLEVDLESLRNESVIGLRLDAERILYEPTISPLTDQNGHLLGYAIVLRDVTTRETRRQRLEVMNRILRHNLRNGMTVIWGEGQVIRSKADDQDIIESAKTITQRGNKLVEMAQDVRQAERILDVEGTGNERTLLKPVIDEVLDIHASEYEATFEYEGPVDVAVPLTPEQLRAVLIQLVHNAVVHNERSVPTVRVRVNHDPQKSFPIRLSVIDDGPGIPETERQPIETGQETDLKHTSGIGLWVVRWVTTSVGGEISFSDREPTGSIITLSLPAAAADAAPDGEE